MNATDFIGLHVGFVLAIFFSGCLVGSLVQGRDTRRAREALEQLRSYNEDIKNGRINYRPEDHIQAAIRGLRDK